jgi:UDPglucose--hexose-1-phosphate uridylyltransferase
MADYDIVVFENKFPALSSDPPEPEVESTILLPVRPSQGVCEVVCYSPDHNATFATLPLDQIRKLTRVWQERFAELSSRLDVEYVFIFENKGREIGVTLAHPHGQIYGYPFIPPTAAIQVESERVYFEEHGRPLMADWLAHEIADEKRIVWQSDTFALIVPFFARYPYEIWVVPLEPVGDLVGLSPAGLDGLAEALHVAARKLDALFGFSMPYVMAMKQRPAMPGFEFTGFHVEFYPPFRTADKLKYLAGSEAAMGAFINDTLPEVTAERLRSLAV